MTGQCATAGSHRPQTDGESMLRQVPVVFGVLLALLSLVMSMSGCASRPAAMQPAGGLSSSDEWRVQTLEEKFLEFKEGRMARQAEMDRLRELLDSLDRRQARTEQDLRDIKDAMDAGDRAAMEQAPREVAMDDKTVASTASGNGRAWDDVPPTPTSEKIKPVPMARKSAAATATAVDPSYAKALALITGGRLAQGRKAMQAFLSANASGPLSANAQYWIGESFYGQKNDAQAIVEFKKVYQAHPKHAKAAAALLKIGYAYERLGDMDNARFYLEALLEDHPDSEPAKLARAKLGNLPQ